MTCRGRIMPSFELTVTAIMKAKATGENRVIDWEIRRMKYLLYQVYFFSLALADIGLQDHSISISRIIPEESSANLPRAIEGARLV